MRPRRRRAPRPRPGRRSARRPRRRAAGGAGGSRRTAATPGAPAPRPPPRRRARRRAARPRATRYGSSSLRTVSITNRPAPTASRSQRPSEYRLASRISANVPTLAIASSCGAAVARRDLAALADQDDAERRRAVEAALDHQRGTAPRTRAAAARGPGERTVWSGNRGICMSFAQGKPSRRKRSIGPRKRQRRRAIPTASSATRGGRRGAGDGVSSASSSAPCPRRPRSGSWSRSRSPRPRSGC